ncbi:MAG TPA: ABC-F family ATP-binding cassette domain-containing protein [Candidatus Saccharibacteria bacterium]|nr:ABC-F family ATP-binding cassette domain-containing protein [Candidatus Saccharibacteria bacterium]
MLKVDDISYETDRGRLVLEDVSFSINRGDVAGLVGPNGSGKTTLLNLIGGSLEPSSGRVSTTGHVDIGNVPQNVSTTLTVGEYINRVSGVELAELEYDRASDAYTRFQTAENLQALCDTAERLARFDSAVMQANVLRFLSDMGMSDITIDRPMRRLSGGQVSRIVLSTIFANVYDIVLLDEPTNNLDSVGAELLEDYVRSAASSGSKAFLVATHDRRFLRNVATSILEVSANSGGIRHYNTSYEEYLSLRDRDLRLEEDELVEHERKISRLEKSTRQLRSRQSSSAARSRRGPRDNDKSAHNFKAERAGTSSSAKIRALDSRLEQMRARKPRLTLAELPKLDFDIPSAELGTSILEANELKVRRAAASTMESSLDIGPFGFHLAPGDRMLIAGSNGSGKTSLLKGMLPLTTIPEGLAVSGDVRLSASARVVYIDQQQSLPSPSEDAMRNLINIAPDVDTQEANSLMARFGLSPNEIKGQPVSSLSGGERMRILLAAAVANKANLLVLDEPTNNLDIQAIDGLQEALKGYKGAVILISHDRDFVEAFGANKTIQL